MGLFWKNNFEKEVYESYKRVNRKNTAKAIIFFIAGLTIAAVLVVFIMSSVMNSKDIADQYAKLGKENSRNTKENFKKPMYVISTYKVDGETSITLSYMYNEDYLEEYADGTWESGVYEVTLESEDPRDLVTPPGTDVIQTDLINMLRSQGYDDTAIAGWLGVIQYESGFDPTVRNSIGASGLCQWLNGRFVGLKNFAKGKGTHWSDYKTQIGYLQYELTNTEKRVPPSKLNGKSVKEVVYYIANDFERCEKAKPGRAYSPEAAARLPYWSKAVDKANEFLK